MNADRPYLYGPALSSLNVLRVGPKVAGGGGVGKMPGTVQVHEEVIEEGGDGDGVEVRRAKGVPEEAERRKKFFLDETRRRQFEFEDGRLYQVDFFNPYLDFNGTCLPFPFPFSRAVSGLAVLCCTMPCIL